MPKYTIISTMIEGGLFGEGSRGWFNESKKLRKALTCYKRSIKFNDWSVTY